MGRRMRVMIGTGGSGGHIFPALALAEALRADGHDVGMAGVFGRFAAQVTARGFAVEELPARGGSFSSWSAVTGFAGGMIASCRLAGALLERFRPDVVVGFGGYASFPVVAAARRRRRPVLIHEQNVIPGKANRCLGWIADRICVSFDESVRYFRREKTTVTGCPCLSGREALRSGEGMMTAGEARERMGLDKDRRTILVLGGSQGSRRLNHEFVRALPLVEEISPQVIHLCGTPDAAILEKTYARRGVPFRIFPFLDDMATAYCAADVAVSRAGAVTVTELASHGLPAVLVPYPFAGGHQKANATVLARAGTATVLEEKRLTAGRLAEMILSFVRYPQGRDMLRQAAARLFRPDAARRVVQETVRLAEGSDKS